MTSYFTPAFIQRLMREHTPHIDINVSTVALVEVDNSASILAVLTSARTERLVGHFGMTVDFTADGVSQTRQMVMKIKPHGQEIAEMLNTLAQACGGELATLYEPYKSVTGFQHTHLREHEIYSKFRPTFTPEIFGLYADNDACVYIILMEYLKDVELLNSVMVPEKWKDEHIKTVLVQMAQWHISMLGKCAPDTIIWNDTPSLSYMTGLTPVWHALLNNAALHCADLYVPSRVKTMETAIMQIPDNWKYLQTLPKTIVHNDLNPRNCCFKILKGRLQLCLYDWELATVHIPQYDVAEFLCFVLDQDRYEQRADYIEFYRRHLNEMTGNYADAKSFHHQFYLASLDFGIHRLGMYMMAHTVSPYPFIPRVVNSFFNSISFL